MTESEAINRLRNVIRLKHLSLSTEQCYCAWASRYCRWIKSNCSEKSPEQKIEGFLSSLARDQVSSSTQNQAFNALLMLYQHALKIDLGKISSLRANAPKQFRYAPSETEVRQLLAIVQDVGGYPTKLIIHLIYGCGLRVCEPLNLRIKDVSIQNGFITLKSAKGFKDRVVSIPCSLSAQLQAQLKFASSISDQDRLNQIPVALPGLLSKKYPQNQFSRPWAFVFPSRTTCVHPRSGQVVRYRCHEANVQRSMRVAARTIGLDITPHHLRHAYATHCLNQGQNPRAIQQAMGHANLETTMGYLHADALTVVSPLQ